MMSRGHADKSCTLASTPWRGHPYMHAHYKIPEDSYVRIIKYHKFLLVKLWYFFLLREKRLRGGVCSGASGVSPAAPLLRRLL